MSRSNPQKHNQRLRPKRLEHSMAEGVSDEEWSRMSESEHCEAVGEQPYDADPYEPGGPGWVHD